MCPKSGKGLGFKMFIRLSWAFLFICVILMIINCYIDEANVALDVKYILNGKDKYGRKH